MHHKAQQFGLPIFEVTAEFLQQPLHDLDLIQRYQVIPIARKANTLHIAIVDPSNRSLLAAIQFQTGMQVELWLVSENDMRIFLQHFQKQYELESKLETTLAKIRPIKDTCASPIKMDMEDEPVSNFVTSLFQDALLKHASDVHIEPYEQHCRIRFRCDGILNEVTHIPTHLADRVITRLKIMANLNIAERRLPQDGRINYFNENKIDIRINTCPTIHGEKTVLRILKQSQNLQLDSLGLLPEQQRLLLQTLAQPQGLILVTGPTGSGKTLTLYAALHYLNQQAKNICTLEDPVEIELKGSNQININPKLGLDFSFGLRSILRQDPDVIMLGELRDADTAKTAIQAAQTGHLILSTLHTNSAIETIMRLQNMGISNYNLAHSITMIIGQRLVRKLCEHCKQKQNQSYVQQGCEHCYHGYLGRTALFECLLLNDAIKNLITADATAKKICDVASTQGYITMHNAGKQKVLAGITSQYELQRCIQTSEYV